MFDFLKRKNKEKKIPQQEISAAATPDPFEIDASMMLAGIPAIPDETEQDPVPAWDLIHEPIGPGYPAERIEAENPKGFYIPLSEMSASGEQNSGPENTAPDWNKSKSGTNNSTPYKGPIFAGVPADADHWEQRSVFAITSDWEIGPEEHEEPKTQMPYQYRGDEGFLRVDRYTRPPERTAGRNYEEVEDDFFQEAPTISPSNLAKGLITEEEFYNRSYDPERRKKKP